MTLHWLDLVHYDDTVDFHGLAARRFQENSFLSTGNRIPPPRPTRPSVRRAVSEDRIRQFDRRT